MATSQPTTNCLYLIYKQTIQAKSYFYVVGDATLISEYQASLTKPFVDSRTGLAMFCGTEPHHHLFTNGIRLKRLRKHDGKIGFFIEDGEFKNAEAVALKSTVEFQFKYWMDKAVEVAKAGVEIPREYLEQFEQAVAKQPVAPPVATPATPVVETPVVDPDAFNPSPIDGE